MNRGEREMTPQEFKAWFEGFTEAFDRLPTKAQWARVKERVAEIDGKSVTERVYVDRYWPLYNRSVNPHHWTYLSASGVGTAQACGPLGAVAGTSYNAMTAMNALGRNEAKALSAV